MQRRWSDCCIWGLHHTPLPPARTASERGTLSLQAPCDSAGRDRAASWGGASSRALLGSPAICEQLWLSGGKIQREVAASHPPQEGLGSSAHRDAARCRDLHCFLYNGVMQSQWLSAWRRSQKPGNQDSHRYCSIDACVYMVFAYFFQFRELSIFNETNFTTN